MHQSSSSIVLRTNERSNSFREVVGDLIISYRRRQAMCAKGYEAVAIFTHCGPMICGQFMVRCASSI